MNNIKFQSHRGQTSDAKRTLIYGRSYKLEPYPNSSFIIAIRSFYLFQILGFAYIECHNQYFFTLT